MLADFWRSLGGSAADVESLTVDGVGDLSSAFPVTDLAVASIGAAALAMSELVALVRSKPSGVTVDRRLASLWFQNSIRPIGWSVPEPWDAIAGDYLASDGWIRLHTNAPHHRRAVERVLRGPNDREAVACAVAMWSKHDLEHAVVDAGGCAAEMRSAEEWADHQQGRAVASENLIDFVGEHACASFDWSPTASRPLRGIRVLDLTRVLAGPVATRFLAGFGADVLRIDPIGWDEPAVVPDVTLGKRCARLDLRDDRDRSIFESLLSTADILVHGYRPGALDGLGFGAIRRREIAPSLIDVSLNAYGWTGPWAMRRGFDSLVQMSTGIADAGMRWKRAAQPVPLPAQALDHATGYLMAATAIRGLTRRLTQNLAIEARLSLARTACELLDRHCDQDSPPIAPANDDDFAATTELTSWGPARRLQPAVQIDGTRMEWSLPASKLGSSSPNWLAAQPK